MFQVEEMVRQEMGKEKEKIMFKHAELGKKRKKTVYSHSG